MNHVSVKYFCHLMIKVSDTECWLYWLASFFFALIRHLKRNSLRRGSFDFMVEQMHPSLWGWSYKSVGL